MRPFLPLSPRYKSPFRLAVSTVYLCLTSQFPTSASSQRRIDGGANSRESLTATGISKLPVLLLVHWRAVAHEGLEDDDQLARLKNIHVFVEMDLQMSLHLIRIKTINF